MSLNTKHNKFKAGLELTNIWGCVFFITVSSVIQGYFSYTREAPDVFKAIIGLCCWLSIFFALRRFRALNAELKLLKPFIVIFSILLVCAIISTIYFRDVYVGNRYVVMLTNMYGALNVFPIYYMLAVRDPKDLRKLVNATIAIIIFGVLFIYFRYEHISVSYYLTYVLPYSLVLLPYLKRQTKYIFILGFALSLVAFFGGARQALLSLAYVICCYFAYKICNKRICYAISLVLMILPVFLVLYSIQNGSILEAISDEFASDRTYNYTEDQDLASDSRTFLYQEFFEDFIDRPITDKIIGQGTVGYYYSFYFDEGRIGSVQMRLGIEIPVLQWIMQCGLLYYFLVYLIFLLAIRRYYLKGRNSFSKIASLLLACYFLTAHISNYSGCNISHLGVWVLVSCAFNDKFVLVPDAELKRMIFPRKKLKSFN